jgi:hypothetical protein
MPIYVWLAEEANTQPETLKQAFEILRELQAKQYSSGVSGVNEKRRKAFVSLAKALMKRFSPDAEEWGEPTWADFTDIVHDANVCEDLVYAMAPWENDLSAEHALQVCVEFAALAKKTGLVILVAGDGMLFTADGAVLPEELQQSISEATSRGKSKEKPLTPRKVSSLLAKALIPTLAPKGFTIRPDAEVNDAEVKVFARSLGPIQHELSLSSFRGINNIGCSWGGGA